MAKKRGGKIRKVMGEYKRGTLKSSSGKKVSNKKQAVAIALSEARRAGEKVPSRKKRRKKGNPGHKSAFGKY